MAHALKALRLEGVESDKGEVHLHTIFADWFLDVVGPLVRS
jgi:hypothetical protein